jgi:hypothetical protein
MTAPNPHETADTAYARHSFAAEQLITDVLARSRTTGEMQIEAAKVAAILALAAAIRSSGG